MIQSYGNFRLTDTLVSRGFRNSEVLLYSVTNILSKICATTFTDNYGKLRMRGDKRL